MVRSGDKPVSGAVGDTVALELSAGSRRAVLLSCVVIALVAVAAFWPGISAPFILDDELYVTNNRTIRRLWPIWPIFSDIGNPIAFRPLFNFSLALNYALGGTEVRGFHVMSLAVHSLAGIVLFALVRRTLLQASLRAKFGSAALPLALAVSLLWAAHPLQSRAVIYIGQRSELLVGLFYLLTLYFFLRGVAPSASAVWKFLAVTACLLGMASKEVMVSAPLAVLLYDRAFVAGTFGAALRQRWRLYLGLASTWLLLGYLVTVRLRYDQGVDFTVTIAPAAYFQTQVRAIVHYLRLSLWPHPLVFDYGPVAPAVSTGETLLSALIFALLLAGTGIALWRRAALGFLGAWFFMILAPSSSVFPVGPELLGEHRMYLPLASIIVLIVLAVSARLARWRTAVLAILLVAAVLGTARRAEDYRSLRAIWGDTVAKRPGNPRAHINLGTALMADGQAELALEHYRRAAAIQPGSVLASNNVGVALLHLGRVKEAVDVYRRALSRGPDHELYNNLGTALSRQGKSSEAIESYRRSLMVKPDYPSAFVNLGVALAEAGRLEEALEQYRGALRIDPDYPQANFNLAVDLEAMGRLDEATRHYRRVLVMWPGHAQTETNLRRVLARIKR